MFVSWNPSFSHILATASGVNMARNPLAVNMVRLGQRSLEEVSLFFASKKNLEGLIWSHYDDHYLYMLYIYIYIDNITIMVNIIVLLLFWDISYIIYQS